jgi:histidinol-phosphatase (PHP family)
MFDSHIHTKFSTDSIMNIEEAITQAAERNLGLIITDHMDTNYPGKAKFNFDTGNFFREYSNYRDEKLLLGVELGMTLEFNEENKALVQNNPFDYVIGSIHFLGNDDIFFAETYEGKSKSQIIQEYFTTMRENLLKHSYIDSLGHIDYIARYAAYDDKEIYYHEYCELIDEVLKAVIKNDIALELNSRRLKDSNAVENLKKIYQRYNELGGKMVTIGSDAHNKESIGANFATAFQIASDLKLQAVYFKERIPVDIKIL